MIAFLLSTILFAGEPSNLNNSAPLENRQIYIAPIKVFNLTKNKEIEQAIDSNAAFTYSGNLWRNSKVPNGHGGKMPITMSPIPTLIYGKDTISYAWDNCDYQKSPMKCSMQNGHYYVETVVHVDDNQLVIKSTLYDSNAQIVSSMTKSNDAIVTWIKQQEVTHTSTTGRDGSQTNTSQYGLEKLPLKWEIPHQLIDDDLHQVMMGLWFSAPLPK